MESIVPPLLWHQVKLETKHHDIDEGLTIQILLVGIVPHSSVKALDHRKSQALVIILPIGR